MYKTVLVISDKSDRFHKQKINDLEHRYVCPKKKVEDRTLLRQLRGLSFNRLQIDAELTCKEMQYVIESVMPSMMSSCK